MAQIPPDVAGVPSVFDLLSQDADSFVERPDVPEVALGEGVFVINAIEGVLSGNTNVGPSLALSFRPVMYPQRGHPISGEPSRIIVSAAFSDRAATDHMIVRGPGLFRLQIRQPEVVMTPGEVPPASFMGATLTLRVHVSRVEDIAELGPFGEDPLEDYISEADLGEYVSLPADLGVDMPRIVGAGEAIHQPFWDSLIRSGDVGSDTTVAVENGAGIENLETTWYDAYICDVAMEDNFCPKARQTGQKRLFQRVEKNPFISNIPVAGVAPTDAAFRLRRMGLTLCFSDPELYALAFRYLRVTLFINETPARAFLASEWLDAAVAAHFDPDPSLGFSWSLPAGGHVIPPAGSYHVDLDLAEPFTARLRQAEDAIQEYRLQGDWPSREDSERFSQWYAEVRVSLKGHRIRGVL